MLEKAIQWIKNNSIPGEGIAISSRNKVSYPEVTGYFIPTLLSIGERDLARQYARWLCSVQGQDGSYGLNGRSYAFDTGQVVRGWLALLGQMPELERPLRRACDWLIKTANSQTGRLTVPPRGTGWSLGRRGEVCEGIHLYVLAPLRQAAQLLNEPRYSKFVDKSLDYYLKNVNLTDFSQPNALTHFYTYIQEALLDLGCENEARAGMASVARFQQPTGAVSGYSDVNWICSAGLAQLAHVWHRLEETNRADAAIKFLEELQNPSGGFLGSYGVDADYFPAEEISWAAKFAVEARQQQIAAHFNQTVPIYKTDIAETDGRVQAVLRNLGNLNGKRVLDAGCGKGRYLAIIKKHYPQADLTGLDISAEMLKYVPSGIRTVRSGILDMPFADEQFDVLICIEALEHVVRIEQAVAELTRVLASGGTLVIIDKNKDKLGALDMPSWEKWFGIEQLLQVMRTNGLEATAEFIGYDNVAQPDGLFVCWVGQKNKTSQKSDLSTNSNSQYAGQTVSVPLNPPVLKQKHITHNNLLRTFNPRILLGERLGLTIYCMFVEAYLHKNDPCAFDIYDKYICYFNEQGEHNYHTFTTLIDSMRNNGYDSWKAVYANPREFSLLNGAHRCAVSIVLGIEDIPYHLRFDDHRLLGDTYGRIYREIYDAEQVSLLEQKQNAYIDQSDSQTALMCRLRRIINDNPKSFNAAFSSKTKIPSAVRPYQAYAKLGILGKRSTEKRVATYGLPHLLNNNMRVLEFGCNCGFLSLEISKLVSDVTAFDIDPAYIAIGNLTKGYLGINNCELFTSPVKDFNSSKTFDCIVSCAVHGWAELGFRQYTAKILSLLKPNGLLLFESHEIDAHPDWSSKKAYLLKYFNLIRSGLIDDVDDSMYASEMREYLILQRK